jgi:THO complex subunit 2
MQRDPEASKSKIKKEALHAEQVSKALSKELAGQEENNSFVLKRLKTEKDKWVGQADSKSDMITNFLQVCIFPRCFFSAPGMLRPLGEGVFFCQEGVKRRVFLFLFVCFTCMCLADFFCSIFAADAMYCAKFAELLHQMEALNWSTVLYYDRVFRDISCIVARYAAVIRSLPTRMPRSLALDDSKFFFFCSCTENEVRRYARFLRETLRLIAHWHDSEATFDRECGRKAGFRQGSSKDVRFIPEPFCLQAPGGKVGVLTFAQRADAVADQQLT